VNGEALGPLFTPPADVHWFWIVVLAPAIPAIVLLLIALVRGRFPGGPLIGGGIAGATWLLSLFAYLLGTLHLAEEAKSVEFCGSCHDTMPPLVESLSSEEESLAAIHYQRGAVSRVEPCYTCHSGYAIWGTVSAKQAGFGHMWRTLTRDYEFPLEHKGPFNIDSCQNCHAGTRAFREVEDHRDPELAQAMFDREIGCTGDCHPAAHPEAALTGKPYVWVPKAPEAAEDDEAANGGDEDGGDEDDEEAE
jgi:hypothetical protein